MQRRDVLRFLASGAALSAIPADLILTLQEARAQTLSAGCRTLNPHQDATVTTFCELIIPATDTPGAKGAKVNEFIDLLLTEWFNQGDKQLFLDGLKEIDDESQSAHGKNFVDCNASEQHDLMKKFDSSAIQFARSHKTTDARAHLQGQDGSFFYNFKRLTLVGYYTSEIGFKQELHKTIIPPGHAGCAPAPEVRS